MELDERIGVAIVDEVSSRPAVPVAEVIRVVSQHYPPALVRVVYWQLVTDNCITRSAAGLLGLP